MLLLLPPTIKASDAPTPSGIFLVYGLYSVPAGATPAHRVPVTRLQCGITGRVCVHLHMTPTSISPVVFCPRVCPEQWVSECDFEEMLCRTAKIRGLWNTAGFIYICFFFFIQWIEFQFLFPPWCSCCMCRARSAAAATSAQRSTCRWVPTKSGRGSNSNNNNK